MNMPIVAKNTFNFTTDTHRVLYLVSEQTGYPVPHLELLGFSNLHVKKFLENCVRASYAAYEYRAKFPTKEFKICSTYLFPFEVEEIDADKPNYLRHMYYMISLQYITDTSENSSLIIYSFRKKEITDKDDSFYRNSAFNVTMESYISIVAEDIPGATISNSLIEGTYCNTEKDLVNSNLEFIYKIYCQKLSIPYFISKDLMLYINYPVLFEYIKSGQKI